MIEGLWARLCSKHTKFAGQCVDYFCIVSLPCEFVKNAVTIETEYGRPKSFSLFLSQTFLFVGPVTEIF
jgi:hypothetical protein